MTNFEKMGVAIKSTDAAHWEDFRVIISSNDGQSYEAPLESNGESIQCPYKRRGIFKLLPREDWNSVNPQGMHALAAECKRTLGVMRDCGHSHS